VPAGKEQKNCLNFAQESWGFDLHQPFAKESFRKNSSFLPKKAISWSDSGMKA
jgi:hypothetical protein